MMTYSRWGYLSFQRLCLCFLCFTGKVFVHCAVGVSRSAALVLAYLMIHHHLGLLSSIRCVQQKRWVFPNRGFLRQLVALEQKLQHKGFNESK